jgi:Tfp pilus assembly protein PilF
VDRISLWLSRKRTRPGVIFRVRVSLLFGLAALLAGILGCKIPGSLSRQFAQQVRPVTDTGRLMRNADYLRKSGRPELAVKELEEAHAQEPDNLEILDALIQCYEALGEFDRAQELYGEAAARGISNPALENNRCFSWFLAGRFDKAEACFREVLARDPGNHTARNNLGLVLCRTNRDAEALALWRSVLNEAEARRHWEQALAVLGRQAPPALARKSSPPMTPSSASPKEPVPTVAAAGSSSQASGNAPSNSRLSFPEPTGKSSNTASSHERPALTAAVSAPAARGPSISQNPGPGQHPSPGPLINQPVMDTSLASGPVASASPPSGSPSPPISGSPFKEPQVGRENQTATIKPKISRPSEISGSGRENHRIEIRNGTGWKNQARDWRSRLKAKGFNVVAIGNHLDFGMEQTTIAYRPEAVRTAQELARELFPQARLVAGEKISPGADIRVSLGHDLAQAASLALGVNPAPAPPSPSPGKAAVPAGPPPPTQSPLIPTGPKMTPPENRLPGAQRAMGLLGVRLEIRNGNGLKDQAREWRSRLSAEGCSVVAIGNHLDFGLKRTTIAYRPEAAQAARELAQKYFPQAQLTENGKISPKADLRLTLGLDLIPDVRELSRAPSP